MVYLKTAEARIGHRGKTAFFGEPDALLPGHGTCVPLGNRMLNKFHFEDPAGFRL